MRNTSSVAAACSFLLQRVLFCSSAMAECVVTTSTCDAKLKRKRTILSIEDKVAIVKQLKSSSARVIAECYGVAKSTISDIKKNRDKILRSKQEMCDMRMSKKVKLTKLGDDVQHDKGVYLWFKQNRMEVQELGYIMDENEIHTWLNSDSSDPGFQLMTDDEIPEHVLSKDLDLEDEPEPEEEEPNLCPVSNSMAAHMFEKCLTWLEYQSEANQYNTCTLRELHALTVHK